MTRTVIFNLFLTLVTSFGKRRKITEKQTLIALHLHSFFGFGEVYFLLMRIFLEFSTSLVSMCSLNNLVLSYILISPIGLYVPFSPAPTHRSIMKRWFIFDKPTLGRFCVYTNHNLWGSMKTVFSKNMLKLVSSYLFFRQLLSFKKYCCVFTYPWDPFHLSFQLLRHFASTNIVTKKESFDEWSS